MDSISVIIPCHNNQRVLPWILRALRASECAGLEIICVDDASDEDISTLVETFDARYIRLPDGEPGRRAAARNRGHQTANGQVTLYLDGDVVPEPRIIEAAIRIHTQNRKVVVKYPVYSIPERTHQASITLRTAHTLPRPSNLGAVGYKALRNRHTPSSKEIAGQEDEYLGAVC